MTTRLAVERESTRSMHVEPGRYETCGGLIAIVEDYIEEFGVWVGVIDGDIAGVWDSDGTHQKNKPDWDLWQKAE